MHTRSETATARGEPHQARPKRLFELDALRAFAIILILVHHLAAYAYTPSVLELFDRIDYYVFPFFFFGLSLFFFASGYALYYNHTTLSTMRAVGGFLKKRAIRIYPLYWIAIAAFIVLGIGTWGNNIAWIIAQVCGAQGLLAPRFGTPVITLWFIGVILLFYLIYPFVVSFSSTPKRLLPALLLPLLLFVVLRVEFNLVDFRFFVYYALFFGGVLASKYEVFNRYAVKPSYVVVSVLLLITALVLIANRSLFGGQPHVFLYSGLDTSAPPLTTNTVLAIIVADILGLIFVYTTFTLSRLVLPSLTSTARRAIGGIAFSAYCVYLFHRPVLVLLADALKATHLVALQKDVLIIVCGIPLIFIVGYALQRGWNSLLAKATPQRQPHARRSAQTK